MCGFTLLLTILLLHLVKQIAVMIYIINNLVYACVFYSRLRPCCGVAAAVFTQPGSGCAGNLLTNNLSSA